MGDLGSIPGLGRSPGEGKGYSGLEKSMECIVHGVFGVHVSLIISVYGFPGASDGKESTCNVADLGSIPGLERSPGGGHGNPLQYSCLENP